MDELVEIKSIITFITLSVWTTWFNMLVFRFGIELCGYTRGFGCYSHSKQVVWSVFTLTACRLNMVDVGVWTLSSPPAQRKKRSCSGRRWWNRSSHSLMKDKIKIYEDEVVEHTVQNENVMWILDMQNSGCLILRQKLLFSLSHNLYIL